MQYLAFVACLAVAASQQVITKNGWTRTELLDMQPLFDAVSEAQPDPRDSCVRVKSSNKGFSFKAAEEGDVGVCIRPCADGRDCVSITPECDESCPTCARFFTCEDNDKKDRCIKFKTCKCTTGDFKCTPSNTGLHFPKGPKPENAGPEDLIYLVDRLKCEEEDTFNLVPCNPLEERCRTIEACESDDMSCCAVIPGGPLPTTTTFSSSSTSVSSSTSTTSSTSTSTTTSTSTSTSTTTSTTTSTSTSTSTTTSTTTSTSTSSTTSTSTSTSLTGGIFAGAAGESCDDACTTAGFACNEEIFNSTGITEAQYSAAFGLVGITCDSIGVANGADFRVIGPYVSGTTCRYTTIPGAATCSADDTGAAYGASAGTRQRVCCCGDMISCMTEIMNAPTTTSTTTDAPPPSPP